MVRTALRIAGLAVFVAAFHVPTASADSRFSLHVGIGNPAPPVVVAPLTASPYGDGYYWEPAYRVWTGHGYRWVPGRWTRRDARSRWEREQWRRERDRGYRNYRGR